MDLKAFLEQVALELTPQKVIEITIDGKKNNMSFDTFLSSQEPGVVKIRSSMLAQAKQEGIQGKTDNETLILAFGGDDKQNDFSQTGPGVKPRIIPDGSGKEQVKKQKTAQVQQKNQELETKRVEINKDMPIDQVALQKPDKQKLGLRK